MSEGADSKEPWKCTPTPHAWDRGWRAKARWKVPALLCNDWACLKIARALADASGRAVLQTAYGAPACAWAGGRILHLQTAPAPDELRGLFDAYRRLGMGVSLTLSRRIVDEGHFADPYCNTLLDLLEEFEGASVITWDDSLARYIRGTHPSLKLVASISRSDVEWARGFPGCAGELDFYLRTLDFYDEVVARCEAAGDEGLLDGLSPVADRCQMLVNQRCLPDCRHYEQHTILGEQAQDRGEDAPKCINPHHGAPYVVYAEGTMEALVERGFTHLKVQGRDLVPHGFARELMRFVAGDGDYESLLGPKVAGGVKMLSLPLSDPLLRTRLPEEPDDGA